MSRAIKSVAVAPSAREVFEAYQGRHYLKGVDQGRTFSEAAARGFGGYEPPIFSRRGEGLLDEFDGFGAFFGVPPRGLLIPGSGSVDAIPSKAVEDADIEPVRSLLIERFKPIVSDVQVVDIFSSEQLTDRQLEFMTGRLPGFILVPVTR